MKIMMVLLIGTKFILAFLGFVIYCLLFRILFSVCMDKLRDKTRTRKTFDFVFMVISCIGMNLFLTISIFIFEEIYDFLVTLVVSTTR